MRLIFFGSDPWFSPPILKALLEAGHQVPLIATKGDAISKLKVQRANLRPEQFGPELTAEELRSRECKVIQAETAEDILRFTIYDLRFTNNNRPDAIVLAAFGPPFLSDELLTWPKYGALNVHASLLPRWRGASPVFAAIAAGDKETGVTIMKMTEKVDRGPILGQRAVKISQPAPKESSFASWSTSTPAKSYPSGFGRTLPANSYAIAGGGSSEKTYETRETLTKKLGLLGGKLIVETLKKIESGKIHEQPQPAKSPTFYTRRLTKDSGLIDWSLRPGETDLERSRRIERFIRAVTPWPGAWTEYRDKGQGTRDKGKILKILRASLTPSSLSPQPSALSPILVQLPGKSPIPWKQFLVGHPQVKFST